MTITLPTPKSVRAGLSLRVVGQADAQVALAVAFVNHLRRITHRPVPGAQPIEFNKENVLLLGPTGSGKTHVVRALAKMMDLPFIAADATKITAAGYVGRDVEDLLLELWNNSGRNLERAQRGIIFLDEVDKIRCNGVGLDVNGEAVQRALLTLFNGAAVTVNTPNGPIRFDTKNVLFICAGAFVGLETIIAARVFKKNTIGFGGDVRAREEDPVKLLELMLQVKAIDLVAYGLIPEFVGRLPVRTATHPLSEDELCSILTEPKDSLIKQCQALLEGTMNVDFSKEALRAIAKEAYAFGTGARALQEIVLEVMRPISYDLPGGKVTVTEEMVRDRSNILQLIARTTVGSEVEPCQFSWDAVERQMETAAAAQAAEANTSAPAETIEEVWREVWRKEGPFGYTRLLQNPHTGGKLHHLFRRLSNRCRCGFTTEPIPFNHYVICDDGVDPTPRRYKDFPVTYKCGGCSKTITGTTYSFTQSDLVQNASKS